MTNAHDRLNRLRRPRLLIRAAHFGLPEYRKTPALRALIDRSGARTRCEVATALFEAEEELDARRRAGDARYRVARHVDLLIALISEVRLLPRVVDDPAPAAARQDLRTKPETPAPAPQTSRATLRCVESQRPPAPRAAAQRHALRAPGAAASPVS